MVFINRQISVNFMYLTSTKTTYEGTMARSSVGTGFTSWYWLQPSGFLKAQCVNIRPLHPLPFH